MVGSLLEVFNGCCVGRVNPNFSAPSEQIRSRLMVYTPIGSTGTNVLDFVARKMCSFHATVCAYSGYVDALQPAARVLSLTPEPDSHGRYIELEKYPVGMTSTAVLIRGNLIATICSPISTSKREAFPYDSPPEAPD